jgi:hypothetical protein
MCNLRSSGREDGFHSGAEHPQHDLESGDLGVPRLKQQVGQPRLASRPLSPLPLVEGEGDYMKGVLFTIQAQGSRNNFLWFTRELRCSWAGSTRAPKTLVVFFPCHTMHTCPSHLHLVALFWNFLPRCYRLKESAERDAIGCSDCAIVCREDTSLNQRCRGRARVQISWCVLKIEA